MSLILQRQSYRHDGIVSGLIDEQGRAIAVTLERSYGNRPKLPAGQYICVRGPHRLHGMTEDFETFEVAGVPDHTGILFHWGNWQDDSEGCILLGRLCCESPKGCMITSSRATFAAFMKQMAGVNAFPLTVLDKIQELPA